MNSGFAPHAPLSGVFRVIRYIAEVAIYLRT